MSNTYNRLITPSNSQFCSVSFADSIDVSLENPSQSRAALQSALEKVTTELGGLKKLWTAERQSLMGEKAALRDTAARLSAEVKTEATRADQERRKAKEAARRIQDEAERERALVQVVRVSRSSK